MLKRNRPDLANGRSDAELLAFKKDVALAKQMTEALRGENETFLTKRGIEATPGRQYLAHFLGPGGAAAVIKADPNTPVIDVLTAAVGKQKAQAMVDANPTILTGKLAGSVTQWADRLMGGSAPGEGIHAMLRPEVREQILARAEQQLQKQTVQDLSAFKTRIEDNQAEAMRTGTVSKPLTLSDFVGKLGAENGPKAYRQHEANVQLGRDVESLKRLDPTEQAELLRSYEPQPGEANYADAVKRHDGLLKAIAAVNKERADDPAAYAIRRLPASGEAFKAFSGALGDPTIAPDVKRTAARNYATTALMEQARIGIPADAQRVVPQAYVDNLIARLNDPKSAGGTLNVVQQIQAQADLWGEHWPAVYRQIGSEGGAAVRVIGSGVQPTAARVLAELANVKLIDILKDDNKEKDATIKKDVLDAFKPLAASMAGNEGMISVFNDFRGQAEKLAAYYVVRGATSQDAATQAFKELVGHKYDFVVGREAGLFSGIPNSMSFRLPKSSGISPVDARAGALMAAETLGTFDIAPMAARTPGISDATRQAETIRRYQRDGVWSTAPDESGLILIYQDAAVRTKSGAPLIVPWAKLGELAKTADGGFGASPGDMP